jgi:DMSO/TMAO reductase YedYZ molybdopterin-dependent catalytic subunit
MPSLGAGIATRARKAITLSLISRGFRGRRKTPEQSDRLPPGQYIVTDFPVLSAGPTPYTPEQEWSFSIEGEIDPPRRWKWDEFTHLPSE